MLLSDPPAPTARPRPAPAPLRRETAPYRALLALPARGDCVGTARHWAAHLLERWGLAEEARDSAVLVVDELTANAARWGHADMTLMLALDPGVLRIGVTDSGSPVPRPRPALDPDEHGRGTGIVRLLAHRTEVRRHAFGRSVRADLRLAPAPRLPAP
jgi:anti-sigma regulatory factor (Ser/Thr protein kinase)